MNWVDALSHAHLDTVTAVDRAKAAIGPEEMHRIVGGYLLHRIAGLPRAPGRHTALEERLRFPPPGPEPTIAGLSAWLLDQIGLPPSERLLDNEGMRAILQWCSGTKAEPGGFFRLFWAEMDPKSEAIGEALDRLDRVVETVILTLQDEDRAENQAAASLPYTLRSLWTNLGQDGAHAHQDRDGVTSAAYRSARRRMLATLLDRPNGIARWMEEAE